MRSILYYFAPKKVVVVPTEPYYVDNQDPRFAYTGNWQYDPEDSDVIWKSGHGVYADASSQVSVSLTFTGQRFTIWAPSTSQYGVTGGGTYVLVDGDVIAQPSQLLNNPDTSVPNNQSWAWYVSPVLPYGKHTLTLANDTGAGGYVAFDGIYVEPTVDVAPRSVVLRFQGTNLVGGDQTLFVDKVEVLNAAGDVVDAKLVNADFSYPWNFDGPYQYMYGNYDAHLGWTFGGGSGVATNGSAFNVPGTPDGHGVMFVQGVTSSEQPMLLPPGRYRVRFLSAQRSDSQYNTMDVYAGAEKVLTDFAPTQYKGFQAYTTAPFTVN